MKNLLIYILLILPVISFSQFQIDSIITTNSSCSNANDGTLTVYTSGGVGTISYDIGSGPQSSNQFSGLSCGSYTVLAVDATPTAVTSSSTINCPNALFSTHNEIWPSCYGMCDGTIDVITTGGTAPYTITGPFGTSMTYTSFTSLYGYCAGTYTFLIEDASGCTDFVVADFFEPDEILVTVTSTDETSSGACDGTATSSAQGGTPPYSYIWNDCNTGTPISQFNGTANNLCPGDYSVTVTDVNGCSGTSNCANIAASSSCNVSSAAFEVNPTCYGYCDGIVELSTTGGVAPYIVTDPFGAMTSYTSFVSLYGYCGGTYTFLVEDNNGCTEPVVVNFLDPVEMIVSAVATDETTAGACDGSVTSSISGGNSPYIYNWTNCSNSQTVGTSSDEYNLCSGDYKVEVTDINGCVATSSCETVGTMSCNVTATYQILQEPCSDQCNGVVDVSVSGGTAPYSITDPNGGPDESFSINWIYNNLCEGTHIVTVTDANGCTFSLTIDIMSLPPFEGTVVTTDESISGACDGTADVTYWGGAGFGYTYDWYNCSTNQSVGSTSSVNGLCPDDYNVVIMDAYGCMAITYCETVNPGQNCPISSVQSNNVSCFGFCDGEISITTSGGAQPYMVNDPNTGNLITYTSSYTLTNLCSGTYTLEIQDAAGCIDIYIMTIEEPAELLHSVTVIDETFPGACDGSISVNATGGIPSYLYSINCSASFQSSNIFNGLCSGAYGVTVQDINGCLSYCDSTDTVGVSSSVGLIENTFEGVNVYPNPASGLVKITSGKEQLDIKIYSIEGKIVLNKFMSRNLTIDVSSWGRGIYIVEFISETEQISKRLIVQ